MAVFSAISGNSRCIIFWKCAAQFSSPPHVHHLTAPDGLLRGDGEPRAVHTIAHRRGRSPPFAHAVEKRAVHFVKTQMPPPPYAAAGGDSVDDWICLVRAAFPLQDFDLRD